ncbi:hypothetical protein PS2_035388 [Malus domestica]
MWAKEEECRRIVESCWNRQSPGNAISRWQFRINDCRSKLTSWNKRKFKHRSEAISVLMDQLGELQLNWGPNREEILKLTIEVDLLREQEESFWKQRSRINWLREGDANTLFFHQSTLHRRRRNKVVKILMEDGALDSINQIVMDDMNQSLLEPISEEEIRMAVRQMGGFKAPGPDRFQGVFYHAYWDCIAKDVYELVLLLSNSDTCPRQLNATHIVLIPKIPNPESNAFIGGRQIQDNIGTAYELFHFMEKMGFHPVWRRLIMGCVSSVNFAVIINGQPAGSNVYPRLDYLPHFFADDTLIFLKADKANCNNLSRLLATYCSASGQAVNLQKSCVFFSANTPMDLAADLGSDLGIPVVSHPGSYLGKEVMIKAVAQAIPAYPMNLFKFPDSICNELDSLIYGFWWGQKNGERKIHWVSKSELGLPKSAGGLGFRNFKSFNDALLAKQCWRLIMEPNSLWASVLKARYFPNCSFLDARKGSRASWVWSSLLVGRDLLLKGAHWQIMDGQRGHPSPGGAVSVTLDTRVRSFICPDSCTWDLNALQPFLSTEDLNAIRDTFIGDLRSVDRFIWPGTKNGQYSVKTGYHWVHARFNHPMALQSRAPNVIPCRVWKLIWKLRVPAKIKHFMWKSLHGVIPTMSELFKKRSMPYPNCPICHNSEESVEHLLLLCPWVEPVWFGGVLNLRIARAEVPNWVEWFISTSTVLGGTNDDRLSLLSFVAFSCWHIWKARCNFVYNNCQINPTQMRWAISNSACAFSDAVGRNPDPSVRRTVASPVARWATLPLQYTKINVDASWSASTRAGFVGIVLRDAEGSFVATTRHAIMAPSVNAAEAMAIMRGSWEAFPSLVKAKRLGESFQDCRWSWTPRSANTTADSLASNRCVEMCDVSWVNRPPSSLIFVLHCDGLPCPP